MTSDATNLQIPKSDKIITGVSESSNTGWFLIHLHDCPNAISVRLDEGIVVIAEGRGRGRLRNTHIPFRDIVRFEAVGIPIGHNCISLPINSESLGECQELSKKESFVPYSIRIIIRGAKSPFVSVYDFGTTPLPILIPALRQLPKESFGKENKALTNGDDCLALGKQIVDWVKKVNSSIDNSKRSNTPRGRTELIDTLRSFNNPYALEQSDEPYELPSSHSDYRSNCNFTSNLFDILSSDNQETLIKHIRKEIDSHSCDHLCHWYGRLLEDNLPQQRLCIFEQALRSVLPRDEFDPILQKKDANLLLTWLLLYSDEKRYSAAELKEIARLGRFVGIDLVKDILIKIWLKRKTKWKDEEPWAIIIWEEDLGFDVLSDYSTPFYWAIKSDNQIEYSISESENDLLAIFQDVTIYFLAPKSIANSA